ncbi:hypothetical protein GGS21DRAFT_534448 [Xylaria nigripes]|nr:hypothetical protein GGS21DRAFT_534448 [Xylaria nigripes]
MPVFIDWDHLLFGSPPRTATRQQLPPHPQRDTSHSKILESRNSLVEDVGPESAVRESVVTEPKLLGDGGLGSQSSAAESVATPEHWRLITMCENDQLLVAVIFLTTALYCVWFGFSRRKESYTASQCLAVTQDPLDIIKRDFTQRTEALEQQLNQSLNDQIKVATEQFQKVMDGLRISLNKRIETLENRIRLDQEALDRVHRALSERMSAFEGYVRTIDAKHLDQEANHIGQRMLCQRLDIVEESFRHVDAKARASAQRIEVIDDSVRVVDSRAKALSQRIEAVEDEWNSRDDRLTLLSHDVNRGTSVIEKLRKQVKTLPDSDQFKGLSRSWETKLQKLETELEETRKALDEHVTVPPPSLTWSHIESVEIEPCGVQYTGPQAQFPDEFVVSPSSSVHSYSTSGSYTRSVSTASTSPATRSPMTPERKRFDLAGFRETTFSSRQKLLAFKGDSGHHTSSGGKGKHLDPRLELDTPMIKSVQSS